VQGTLALSILRNDGVVTEQMYERGARLNAGVAAREVRAEDEVAAGAPRREGDNGATLDQQAQEAGI
jgi:hypothetical protein